MCRNAAYDALIPLAKILISARGDTPTYFKPQETTDTASQLLQWV